jgi:ATP-dependent protease HslVU (ClpYQ) peptidase subunit
MTCIVGLEHKGKVYIGGDSAGVDGYDITIRGDLKVFRNGPFLMGFTASFRRGQILQYVLHPPIQAKTKSDMKFLTVDFINSIRKAFKKAGYLHTENDQEFGGRFLFGYKGKLYIMDSDFQIGYSLDPYQAIGCGAQVATGSLHTTQSLEKISPDQRVERALKAAAHLNAGVAAPFTILSI